jgi:hypothetical protein
LQWAQRPAQRQPLMCRRPFWLMRWQLTLNAKEDLALSDFVKGNSSVAEVLGALVCLTTARYSADFLDLTKPGEIFLTAANEAAAR